ncbi:MAG: glycosyltransferase [Phycisphaerae bacterium]|nr:glycosyltransferase [Phycisphaerae bacterium]
MIDARDPDFSNRPTAPQRPTPRYRLEAVEGDPPVSIITPCYNVGPWLDETAQAVARQSFQHFEWLLVDDGSTNATDVATLRRLAERDPRIRVITQANVGPSAARNRGAREARGRYLFWLDSDDLIEPTYIEKAFWCLESHPQFAFCNSWTIGFEAQQYLWPRGFERGRACLHENQADHTSMVRRDAHRAIGGYDESIRIGHEDWDYWLTMAAHGYWGWTIPEFLIWYRRREDSRITQTEGDAARKAAFEAFLRKKHAALYENEDGFPHPPDPDDLAPAAVTLDIPVANPLVHSDGECRLLLLVPWLNVGGADRFNLDLVAQLRRRDWEITIATTLPSDHPWQSEFTRHTPDVFCLDKFLKLADYPRFLLYLLRSRGITHVLMSNCQLGYELLPLLRAHYPPAAVLDSCHSITPAWKNGGYPAMAVRWSESLDLHTVSHGYLRRWLIEQGVPAEKVETFHTNLDPATWNPAAVNAEPWRRKLLGDAAPVGRMLILFAGRFVEDKRPEFLLDILRHLRDEGVDFVAALVGDGKLRPCVEALIDKHRLRRHIRVLGTLATDDVRSLIAAADVFLLPSQVEGIAVVLFEAMAMETVPVSADVGGQSELVTPDVGYLIPHAERNVELRAYVDVLRRLAEEPDRRRALAVAARRRIVEQFNLDRMGDALHGMLKRAAENHAASPCPTMSPAMAAECAATSIDRFRLERLADYLWHRLNQQESGGPESAAPATSEISLARAELNFIENSGSWRAVQRLKRTWLYRAFARLAYGPAWDRANDCADPRDRLAAIKRSRIYRLRQAARQTALYRAYARRRYGPDFSGPWK